MEPLSGVRRLGDAGMMIKAVYARDDVEQLIDLVDLARNLLISAGCRPAPRRWK
jgi:hypothetical protein